MTLNPGDLVYEFMLQTPDTSSLDPTAWTDIETVWAAVHPIGQREQMRFGVPLAEGQSLVTIRHRTDVSANDRLVDDPVTPTRILQVLGYSDPDGSRNQLDLLVVERL